MDRPIQPRWLEHVIVMCAASMLVTLPIFAIALLCGAPSLVVLGAAAPIVLGLLGLTWAYRMTIPSRHLGGALPAPCSETDQR